MKTKSVTLLASAARTATPPSIEFKSGQFTEPNSNASFIKIPFDKLINAHIIIDVTVDPALASVQPVLEAKDQTSGKFYDLIASIAAITAVGTTVLKLGPDIITAANLAAQDFIPDDVRLTLTHADGDSITYSVGMNYQFDDK